MEVRMKKQTKIFLLFAIVSPVLLTAESYKYSGKAGDLKSGKFLYTDNHIETRSEGKHLSSVITYRDAKGNVIARKNIQFTKNSYLPDFELEDLRSGYIEGGVLQGKSYKVYYEKDKNSEKKEKILSLKGPSTADGGFDHFVRKNWDDLISGKTVKFSFIAPSQLYQFDFLVSKISSTSKTITLKMRIENFLLNILVPPINIIYDSETKRIIQYEGISNINNEEGKSYFVKIVYDHLQN